MNNNDIIYRSRDRRWAAAHLPPLDRDKSGLRTALFRREGESGTWQQAEVTHAPRCVRRWWANNAVLSNELADHHDARMAELRAEARVLRVKEIEAEARIIAAVVGRWKRGETAQQIARLIDDDESQVRAWIKIGTEL